uniref:Uncharacterized protein n=1 Tax=Anguilla anguilla TaxID=7936 RepID=A0A0E9VI85_ANGAN
MTTDIIFCDVIVRTFDTFKLAIACPFSIKEFAYIATT